MNKLRYCKSFSFAKWAVISGLYCALIGTLHHDVLAHLSTNIIAGWQVGGVFVWDCWWFQKSILFGNTLTPFFTTVIMFPAGVPILMHSPLYTMFCLLAAPLKDPYATYNLFCLLGYALRGLSMAALAYYLIDDHLAAFFAGLVFMFSHDNLTQNFLGHAGQANAMFVPIFLLGLLMLIRENTRRSCFIFLLGAIGCILTTPYVGFHMIVFILPTMIIFLSFSNGAETPQALYFQKLLLCLLISGVAGIIFYWPLLTHSGGFLGGAETFALQPRSFLLPPFWHRSPYWHDWVATDTPELRMGFFSWILPILIAGGLRGNDYKENKLWFILFGVGFVFSLGSFVKLPSTNFKIPLPYWIFEQLPILKTFRAPARLVQLCWIGLSILSAIAVKNLFPSRPFRFIKVIAVAVLSLVFMWEMDVSAVASHFTVLPNGAAYRAIKADPRPFGILELPVAIDRDGSITINAQLFMLGQPLHEKPLVLARPHRHTIESIALCENVEVFYELTHPHALVQLYQHPHLHSRLETLCQNAKGALRAQSVSYVIFHTKETFFSDQIMNAYSRFLNEAFGPPMLVDEYGLAVFKVF